MRTTPLSSLAFLVAASAVTLHAQSKLTVRDPNASFLNIPARRAALPDATDLRLQQAISQVKSCSASPMPPPPPSGQDIPPHYLQDSHGPSNPAEREAAEPYSKVQRVAALGANRYLLTGDPAEANCVLHILLPWARARTMLDYDAKKQRQLWYECEWTIESLALSVSVIRGEPSLKPSERDEVIAWLHQAVKKLLAGYPGSITSRNNHFFFRGLAAAAVGVISNDNELFQYGLATYATAIGELNPDGSFPLEMARHELALHYQAFAIKPLVMIAALAARQGYNIYPLEQNHQTLADAVAFLNRAIADRPSSRSTLPNPNSLTSPPDPPCSRGSSSGTPATPRRIGHLTSASPSSTTASPAAPPSTLLRSRRQPWQSNGHTNDKRINNRINLIRNLYPFAPFIVHCSIPP